jgi:hypothetical protein
MVVCVLLGGVSQVASQDPNPPDPFAASNGQLETWAQKRGIQIKMIGPVAEGDIKIKGLKAIYDGGFKKGNTEWRIRRYAVEGNPEHGDILRLGWFDREGRYTNYKTVYCDRNGMRDADVQALVRGVAPKK